MVHRYDTCDTFHGEGTIHKAHQRVHVTHGRFECGRDCSIGANVVVDVQEEVIIGDRCVIPDNAYFSGRRVEIGSDFYGYSHEWKRLDIGRGRRDDEDAILKVGARSTFHDNRIDLAKSVTIGNDVGLSPEVSIYCHSYWQSVVEGFPCSFKPVEIKDGAIIGYRSTILPGAVIGKYVVVGAHSLVSGSIASYDIYGGSPARRISTVIEPTIDEKIERFHSMGREYKASTAYRGLLQSYWVYPNVRYSQCQIDVIDKTFEGTEDEYSDDLRWFLFTRGVRIYTNRPFRKMRKQ